MSTPKTLKEAINNGLKECFENHHLIIGLHQREAAIGILFKHIKDRLAQDFSARALEDPSVIQLWTRIFLSPDLSQSSIRTPSQEIPADLSGSLTQSQTERECAERGSSLWTVPREEPIF